jgi:hypothetical protein
LPHRTRCLVATWRRWSGACVRQQRETPEGGRRERVRMSHLARAPAQQHSP